MRLAVYSRRGDENDILFIRKVLATLQQKGCELFPHEHCREMDIPCVEAYFGSHDELAQIDKVDFMLSFGGDGTYIDAANLVGDLNIPMLGVNTGRIGFLTAITRNNYELYIQKLLDGQYVIENRALLHLSSSQPLPLESDFALNDITVRTSDENSINAIKVWVGGKMVNTYWGDGLIIATPTGSTAYSLSCGGPIIVPAANVNVLTPIASHTLAVRPMVISADEEIRLVVESRNNTFSLALDSHRVVVDNPVELRISKAKFHIKTVLFEDTDFYRIISEKLLWGLDKRNLGV